MFGLVNLIHLKYHEKLHEINDFRAIQILENLVRGNKQGYAYPTFKDPDANYVSLKKAGWVKTYPNDDVRANGGNAYDTPAVDRVTSAGMRIAKPILKYRKKADLSFFWSVFCLIMLGSIHISVKTTAYPALYTMSQLRWAVGMSSLGFVFTAIVALCMIIFGFRYIFEYNKMSKERAKGMGALRKTL